MCEVENILWNGERCPDMAACRPKEFPELARRLFREIAGEIGNSAQKDCENFSQKVIEPEPGLEV